MSEENAPEGIDIKYPDLPAVFFVGTSGKGVTALQSLAEQIPVDFPAPIFLLLHRQRTSTPNRHLLPELLQGKSNLPINVITVCPPYSKPILRNANRHLNSLLGLLILCLKSNWRLINF